MAKLFTDLLIALPIGIIYNMTIHKTAEIFNNNIDYNNKIQRDLIIAFGGAILSLIIANIIFCTTCKYKNRALRYGLYFGSFLLFVYTLIYNWNKIGNDTKYIIMLLTLISLMWYIYNNFTDDENNNYNGKYLAASYINYDSESFLNDDD